MVAKCSNPSEIYVNAEEGVAILKCFRCGFTHELGPGCNTDLVQEIEMKDHRSARWKRG